MTTLLITIPFSHYCEKARWALDRVGIPYEERGHLPLFHYVATYPRARQRTVPILIDGKTVVRDSTDIVAWADAQKLNFPLLSDFNKEVTSKYDVLNPDMIGLKGIAKRAVFVIDRHGIVRHREVLEDARNEPDYGKVKQALASL